MSGLDHWRSAYQALASDAEPGWLRGLRAEAWERFAALGFPTRRLEDWKYTNVDALAATPFALVAPRISCDDPRVARIAALREDAPERLEPLLGQVLDAKERAFAQLATALLDDGVLVSFEGEAESDEPVQVAIASVGGATMPRVLVESAPGSRGSLVIDLREGATAGAAGAGAEGAGTAGLTNCVLEGALGANASLDVVLLQREGDAHSQVASAAFRLERDARLRVHTLCLGGALLRNDLDVSLQGEGAECDLRGLFVGAGERHVDNHTTIDHAVPHTTSRELYKGILGGRSRGVFRGAVLVRPDAQKTDSKQSNPNLLLSAGAEIDTKPQLEIHADDVRCAHGSTIGQLDPDALFYLRSRGVPVEDARNMLVRGFAEEITAALPGTSVQELARNAVQHALEEATG